MQLNAKQKKALQERLDRQDELIKSLGGVFLKLVSNGHNIGSIAGDSRILHFWQEKWRATTSKTLRELISELDPERDVSEN